MTKPAARVGDLGTPPHVPPPIAPGTGSADVLIGGKPAWRTNLDKHICTLPIAPPAPAPHGPETCFLGSLSVMINNQMAVRQGDILIGAGPPNPIVLGLVNVLIGDKGFGLADPANMTEFCSDFANLQREWQSMTPEQRRQELQRITNKQLSKSGLPPQSVVGSAAHAPGNAQYRFSHGAMEVSAQQLTSSSLNAAGGRELANAVYHEARHAEQWSLMARQQAAAGQSAAQISARMGVPASMAKAAAANPLQGSSAPGNLASACHESVYGARGNYRNQVLNDIGNHYDEYRALPEEQDAWKTGDSTPCGAPSP